MAGRGRKQKAEVDLRALAMPDRPDAQAKNMFGTDAGYPFIAGNSPVDKEAGITSIVDDRIKTAVALAQKTGKAAPNPRVWGTGETPQKKVTKLKHEHWISQRMIEFLETHLAAHVIAQGSIERQLKTAEAEIESDDGDIPATLLQFVRRLDRAGLKASSVQNFSNTDIAVLTKFLNGVLLFSSFADLDVLSPMIRISNRATPEEVEGAEAESARIIEEATAARGEIDPGVLPDLVPTLPLFGQSWNDPLVDVPLEFWCSDLKFNLPYRWAYRVAAPDEIKSVIQLPFPETDSWAKMIAKESEFARAFKAEITDLPETVTMMGRYLGYVYDEELVDVPENWIKAWLLVLWARTEPAKAHALLGSEIGIFFAGVKLPVMTMGGNSIRVFTPIAAPGVEV